MVIQTVCCLGALFIYPTVVQKLEVGEMKFTSFKQIPLSIFIVVLTTVSSYSSERVSGSQIKDQIIAQASKAGLIVVPQTPDQKVYYPL